MTEDLLNRGKFLNPITLSFELLQRYRAHLRESLYLSDLSSVDVDTILRSIEVDRGLFLSLNRRYKTGATGFRQFCADHSLSSRLPDCLGWFSGERLYIHQERAILSILEGKTTIVSTGTGSGKTEAFLIPILNHCLKHPGPGVKALIIYPMNALANDQVERIKEATLDTPVTYGIFVGPVDARERDAIRRNPPDVLITNYVMLDWMLTRSKDQSIFDASRESLRYIVLDEIHTYRGSKATHLKFLLSRLKTRFSVSIVQIGTSATLQKRDQYEGYLVDDSARRDAFVHSLLGVEQYKFIEPEYEPEPDVASSDSFFPLPDPDADLGWVLETDPETGLANLGRLMCKSYSTMDLGLDAISQVSFYRDLEQHVFIRAIRQLLIDHGAQSFVEIVRLLSGLLPASYPRHRIEDMTKAYLSAAAFANHHAAKKGPSILDFRIHLFLRNVGGSLKRCIKCGKYHSGNQDMCQDCGFPLFCVYRHDIRQCVGKVSGNRLRWTLYPESDDMQNTYYVLTAMDTAKSTEHPGEILGFRHDAQIAKDEIVLDYDVYGRLRLKLLPVHNYKEVVKQTIPLVDREESHEYLRTLVQTVLDFEPPGRKKLLGFVDNREMASRTASILQDEFASNFLKECLKLWYPRDWSVDLLSTVQILHRKVAELENLSEIEQAILGEIDLWYWRYVSMPPRQFSGKQDLLRLREPGAFSEFEADLLGIFITERAFAKDYDDDCPCSCYIKFWKYHATDRKGIHCEPGEHSEDPRYPSISLSGQAREYQSFVSKHSDQKVVEGIESLVERGVLQAGCTSDDKTHYYLDPRAVCFSLPASAHRDYAQIRDRYLLTTVDHSSDVPMHQRREVEARFKKGNLNVVVATPTLEMGIDIGDLKNVLMIGVPPLPSNYAQRAGRAGRKRDDNFALIVTFCSEWKDHDIYYYQRPKLMINGVISPPAFDPFNSEIVSKHVSAFMLEGIADDRQQLKYFVREIDVEIQRKAHVVQDVFGAETCAEAYLLNDFRQQFLKHWAQAEGRLQPAFYKDGFFPDYSFRRDKVYLLDREKQVSSVITEGQLVDSALSEREPELAYYKFSPGATVYVAGDVYMITPEGRYTMIDVDGEAVRCYQYLLAEKQVRYAAKRKEFRKYARTEIFWSDQPFLEKAKVLGVAYDPNCRILFLNRGSLSWEEIDPFFDEECNFSLGYELYRQALILRFDALVCADDRLVLSFASALDRTIKDQYGLDEGEIRLIQASPPQTEIEEGPTRYVILYDADGNGNVPLEAVYKNLDQEISIAHRTMSECQGSAGQPCETGCYLCLRSYNTRFFASAVDKETALMFTGYLLGKNRFKPSISEPEGSTAQFDLELRIAQHGSEFTVQGPRGSYSAVPGDGWNEAIFDVLTKAVQAESSEGMQAVKIVVGQDYIANAINSGTIDKGKEALARLQFNLLRFRHVLAEKGRV
jgi:superfamily II DNA/RNA helicase